jgi:hypothetical protein
MAISAVGSETECRVLQNQTPFPVSQSMGNSSYPADADTTILQRGKRGARNSGVKGSYGLVPMRTMKASYGPNSAMYDLIAATASSWFETSSS